MTIYGKDGAESKSAFSVKWIYIYVIITKMEEEMLAACSALIIVAI